MRSKDCPPTKIMNSIQLPIENTTSRLCVVDCARCTSAWKRNRSLLGSDLTTFCRSYSSNRFREVSRICHRATTTKSSRALRLSWCDSRSRGCPCASSEPSIRGLFRFRVECMRWWLACSSRLNASRRSHGRAASDEIPCIDDLGSRVWCAESIADHFGSLFEEFEFELNIYSAPLRRLRFGHSLFARLNSPSYWVICMRSILCLIFRKYRCLTDNPRHNLCQLKSK